MRKFIKVLSDIVALLAIIFLLPVIFVIYCAERALGIRGSEYDVEGNQKGYNRECNGR